MSLQQRTVNVNRPPVATEDVGADDAVNVAAFGHVCRARPGRSVLETLQEAGVSLPGRDQTVKVARRGAGARSEVVTDLSRVLEAGETVAVTHNVRGGGGPRRGSS